MQSPRFHRASFPLLCFLLALVVLLLSQLVFAVVNHVFFSVDGFSEILKIAVGNVRFGLSAVAVYLMPFLLVCFLPFRWRRLRNAALWLYGVGVSLMLAVNIADTPYYQYTFRRLTADIFTYLSQGFGTAGAQITGGILSQFWPYLLYFLVLDTGVIYLAVRLSRRMPWQPPVKRWRQTLALIVCMALDLLLVRGGLFTQHKPLAPVDAVRYASSDNTALVVNSPFSLYRSMGKTAYLYPLGFYGEDELETIYSPLMQPATALVDSTLLIGDRRPNVVLIILESFSEEYMGCLNGGGESYTPFLDSLYPYCATYRGLANGKRSIEALPALLEGIPSLMDGAYITSPFAMNRVDGLPAKLRRHGYSTAMFHGAYNGSMNFDGFAKMSGMTSYYGMDQYDGPTSGTAFPDRVDKGPHTDYDGTWGIFDEPFLQYSLRQLDTMSSPFFAAVYTISSHQPYTLPEQYRGRFKQGPIPLLETVGYADYALSRFFAEASRSDWFANTLFIITADHAAQPLSDNYRHGQGLYRVPLMFYMPDVIEPRHSERMFQHTDLMPTVLDMLSLGEQCCCFGTSVLRGDEPFHIVYNGDCWALTLTGGRSASICGNLENTSKTEATDECSSNMLRAILQQYNNRMLRNRLY